MAGRGASARHSQRGINPKPKSLPEGSNTAWMTDFIPYLEGLTTPLTTESLLVLPLGATAPEREQRLRQLTRMGILQMRAVWTQTTEVSLIGVMGHTVDRKFSHFEWEVVK